MKRIIVVGGGASGLVAAIVSARNGNLVTIIERNNNVGKKILITGAGKCNYWNSDMSLDHYRSINLEFLNKFIYDNKDKVLPFFDSIGIVPRIKNGYYYPYSNSAISVQNGLLLECKKLNIKIVTNTIVTGIKKEKEFIINTNNGIYKCDKVVIACGSKASPKTGSDGSGYDLVKKLGHSVVNPLPALVQLIGSDNNYKEWSGIRCDVKVSLFDNDKFITTQEGEIQLTDYGVSGIVCLNLSGRVSRGLDINHNEEISINFIPFVDNLKDYIDNRNNVIKNRTIIELLESIINYKLLYVLLKKIGINSGSSYNELNNNEKNKLIQVLSNFKVRIIGTKDFDFAQVVSGGVPLTEVDINTLESKFIKDLYITGELLDVDGDCGGYNLGMAWMSGIRVGESV